MESELLPRVREGTYHSVVQSISDEYETDGQFIKRYIEHIRQVNPLVFYMILNWVDDLEGEEYIGSLISLLALYRLLESEAEARIFEKEMEV